MLPRNGEPPERCTIQGASTGQFVEALRQEIAQLESVRRPEDRGTVSSGCEGLDRLLPGGGFHRGTLVEWFAAGEGTGVETLAMFAAREACREGGAIVVLDPSREFYPPAAVRLGIPPEGMLVVQASTPADNLWALDQSLRCPGVAAVLVRLEKLDGRTFRRLQLAAESSGGLGLLVRPEPARREPSWADVRLRVEPRPVAASGARRRLRIELLRIRGAKSDGSIEVEIDDETRTVHLAPRLARAADPRRAAGA